LDDVEELVWCGRNVVHSGDCFSNEVIGERHPGAALVSDPCVANRAALLKTRNYRSPEGSKSFHEEISVGSMHKHDLVVQNIRERIRSEEREVFCPLMVKFENGVLIDHRQILTARSLFCLVKEGISLR
jgi:hypothetical protein